MILPAAHVVDEPEFCDAGEEGARGAGEGVKEESVDYGVEQIAGEKGDPDCDHCGHFYGSMYRFWVVSEQSFRSVRTKSRPRAEHTLPS